MLVDRSDGETLRGMFAAGTGWLERNVHDINAINVFPVPDGDTGTNMLHTMRSAMAEASKVENDDASLVARSMARGALLGARGNSGVILSQFWRGLSGGLGEGKAFTGRDFAYSLAMASDAAYAGVISPVEGTILTVLRDMASAAEAVVKSGKESLLHVLERVVEAAKSSVDRTPTLLPALREAGVVDAGGQGMYVLLSGALRFLKKGKKEQEEDFYLSVSASSRLQDKGEADKVEDWACESEEVGIVLAQKKQEKKDVSVVAVAVGEGLAGVFEGLGVDKIVLGGQTMNPSVRELLNAVEAVSAPKVILLPNNKNIVLAASQASSLSDKEVKVVPSFNFPQGIAALLAFNHELGLEENADVMAEALQEVRVLEITRAVRSACINGEKIKKGQHIAMLDGEDMVACGDNSLRVILEALAKIGVDDVEVMTFYYGCDRPKSDFDSLVKAVKDSYPVQVEMVYGGQPHYDYIIALE